MSKKVKYSVVVAVYNRPEEMIELLKSIADQTFRDLEIIIVDDGSDRSSRLAFQKYKSQLNLSYFFTENQGPALARNYRVKKSEGEWIIFFDSDCSIPNNYFFEVEKFLAVNDVSLYGGPDMMDESFTYLQKSINFSMTSFLTTGGMRGHNKNMIAKFYPRSHNMGVKKKIFDKVGGFGSLRHGQDIELSNRIINENAQVKLLENVIVYHRRRTTLMQFFRQVFNWGVARINLSKICLLYTSPSPRDRG